MVSLRSTWFKPQWEEGELHKASSSRLLSLTCSPQAVPGPGGGAARGRGPQVQRLGSGQTQQDRLWIEAPVPGGGPDRLYQGEGNKVELETGRRKTHNQIDWHTSSYGWSSAAAYSLMCSNGRWSKCGFSFKLRSFLPSADFVCSVLVAFSFVPGFSSAACWL